MAKFHKQAESKWRDILVQIGIDDNVLDGRHHPCPVCGGTDRFRFDDKDGRGTWFCNQGQPQAGDGIVLVQKFCGINFVEALERVDKILDDGAEEIHKPKALKDPKIALNKLWLESRKLLEKDPVSIYLKSRGLTLIPKNVEYCPRCYCAELNEYISALVAKIHNAKAVPISIHRIYLWPDGKPRTDLKARKKLMPGTEPLAGSAVRLFTPATDGTLGIAEGIETAIATTMLYKIPTWSCLNAVLMLLWEPPEDVDSVVIYGDNDANYTGQTAAYTLANKLQKQGITVEVKIPPKTGTDFNDLFLETKGAKNEL